MSSNHKTELTWIMAQWKPIIVGIVETHVTTDFNNNEIGIDGYNTICCYTHSRHTGGVILYVKEEYKYKEIVNIEYENNVWIVGAKVNVNKENYYIYMLYHSPSKSDAVFIDKLNDLLEDIVENKGIIYIIGDFNINLAEPSYYSTQLTNTVKSYGLVQIVNKYTRITNNTRSKIDLVITNVKDAKHEVHNTPKISDHSIVTIELEKQIANTTEKKLIRNYKRMNTTQFQMDLLNRDWIYNSTDIDDLAETLADSLLQTLNEHAPVEEIVINTKWGNKRWWTRNINDEMKERDRLYRKAIITKVERDWIEYKLKRNSIVTLIRREKQKYYQEKIDQVRNNPKEMWKELKKITIGNRRNNIGKGICFEDTVISDNQTVSEKFNSYFLDSICQLCTNNNGNNIIDNDSLKKINTNCKFESFKIVEMNELRKVVGRMKNKESSVNGINTRILKLAYEIIGDRFLQVINTSLQSGRFPTNWKLTTIIPIEKITNTIKCEEHRPINMVPCYEKLLEMVVNEQFIEYIENNKLLTAYQAGFRNKNSCESAIQTVLYKWKDAIEQNLIVGVVFLDFKRAFETINRQLLILKLKRYGLGSKIIEWFESYLDSRKQVVKYGETVSSEQLTTYGVPQGTVLGPNLFILYINDIVHHIKDSNIQLFADDTILYVVGSDVQNVINIINIELENVLKWLNMNSLYINVNKTKFMIIKSKLSRLDTENHVDVLINNIRIDQVNEIKYLGVIIDEHLSFSNHAIYVANKVIKKANLIGRAGQDMSIYTKLTIYKTIILPHFNFCSTVLFLLNNQELQILQKRQNRVMRHILNCNRRTSIKLMLDTLNLLSVRQIIYLNTLIFIYKIVHNMVPIHLLQNCTFVREIHDYNTRGSQNFYIPTVKHNYSQKSLYHNGLKLYNSLPEHIKESTTLNKFKLACKHYVKTNVNT